MALSQGHNGGMKTIQFTLLLSSVVLISSCAFFSPAPEDQTYRYLTGEGLSEAKPKEFEKALSRERNMAGGNYLVKAYPFTEAYLVAKAREQANLRGLNAIEEQKVLDALREKYTADKTCFHFNYEVLLHDKSSRLEHWKLNLIDDKDQEYPLEWNSDDLKRSPIMTRKIRSGDKLEQWLGDGVACTYAKPSLNKGFGLKITPNFVQFPFDKTAKLFWEFPEIKIVEGKEVKVEKKKRSYKSYRGW